MKKRIISAVLAFILLCSLAPAALAEGHPSAQWKNFRNSDANMAITTAETPKAGAAKLNWANRIGTNWATSPSVQIIVDDCLITMSEKKILKLSLEDGNVVGEGTMVTSTSFGYTPPTYCEDLGLIIAPLGTGTLQAFDAVTLETAWVFKDAIGGQAQTPVAYSDGKLYTGFWMGDTKDANFVCVDAATGELEWSYTVKGGFYWSGPAAVGDFIVVGTDDGVSASVSGDSKLLVFRKTYSPGETAEPAAYADLTGLGDQHSSIAYADGRVYFTTRGGYLCSAVIDPETGAVSGLKTAALPAPSTSTPIVFGDYIYLGVGGGLLSPGGTPGFVIADRDTLETVKTVPTRASVQCTLLLSTAYLADEGRLCFYTTYNAEPGGISLITIEPDDPSTAELTELYEAKGYEQYCIASIICDEDGNLYYKNDSGTVFSVGSAEYCPSADFTDVPADAWYHGAVDYAVEKGLMKGTSPTTFEPGTSTTRGMIVTMLWRLEGSPAVSAANPFSDVAEGAWYRDAIVWASENGIVGGYGDGRFGPADEITREQLATMLWRYAKQKGYDVSGKADLSGYTDAGDISSWALDAVKWANAEGLVNGRTAETLVPGGTANRAEAAAIFMRFLGGRS
ncbi:MAG: S-layer homology domain-containing protein [Oscillospiraceae bacterium]|nr:S-layer homology domain-containing protein [Oscillospiraceae bacterium]